jgi:hypothetical protein
LDRVSVVIEDTQNSMHYTHQQYRFAKIDRDRGDGYSMGIKEQKRTSCERSGEYDEILAINDWDREGESKRESKREQERERRITLKGRSGDVDDTSEAR